MSRTYELLCVGVGEGLVHIHHADVQRSGVGMGGVMRFEAGNLGWLCERLRGCRDTWSFAPIEHAAGGDSFRISQGGPEQAPVIVLRNRRSAPLPYAGTYVLAFSPVMLEQLLATFREVH